MSNKLTIVVEIVFPFGLRHVWKVMVHKRVLIQTLL